MTLYVSAIGLVIGFAIALVVVSCGLSKSAALRRACGIYVFVFRGVPLLVQLLVAYLMLPSIGVNVPPSMAAIIAIGFCEGAYLGEILRGGFIAIPPGQIEAARMLGLRAFSTLLHIQLPQALRLTMPALTNEVILLTKASSLVSAIGVSEITLTAQNIASSNYQPLQVYSLAALVYVVLCGAITLAGRRFEKHYALAD